MKLTVDTNILFSYFWKTSLTRRLIQQLELYAPAYALEELQNYKEAIKKKAKVQEKEYQNTLQELQQEVNFIPLATYKKELQEAHHISPDSNDIDFLALAAHLQLPLWTNDKALQEQKNILILETKDIITIITKT